MQSLAVVVLRKIICNTIKRESAAADTIGYPAYCSTKETFTGIVDISFPITIANYDIVNVAVSVRSKKTDDTSTEIRHLHRDISIAQGI